MFVAAMHKTARKDKHAQVGRITHSISGRGWSAGCEGDGHTSAPLHRLRVRFILLHTLHHGVNRGKDGVQTLLHRAVLEPCPPSKRA